MSHAPARTAAVIIAIIACSSIVAAQEGPSEKLLSVARQWAATAEVKIGDSRSNVWFPSDSEWVVGCQLRGTRGGPKSRTRTVHQRGTRAFALNRCVVRLLKDVYPDYPDSDRLYEGLSLLPSENGLRVHLDHDVRTFSVARQDVVGAIVALNKGSVAFKLEMSVMAKAYALAALPMSERAKSPERAAQLLAEYDPGPNANRVTLLRFARMLKVVGEDDDALKRWRQALAREPSFAWGEIEAEQRAALALGFTSRALVLGGVLKHRNGLDGRDARLRLVLNMIPRDAESVVHVRIGGALWLISVGLTKSGPSMTTLAAAKKILFPATRDRALSALQKVIDGVSESVPLFGAPQVNKKGTRAAREGAGVPRIIKEELSACGWLEAAVVVAVRCRD